MHRVVLRFRSAPSSLAIDWLVALLALSLALLASPAFGQGFQGAISARVVDAQGAVVSGADATLRSQDPAGRYNTEGTVVRKWMRLLLRPIQHQRDKGG